MYLATVKEGAFTFQLMAPTQLLYQTIQLRIVLMEWAHFLASVFAILVQILPSISLYSKKTPLTRFMIANSVLPLRYGFIITHQQAMWQTSFPLHFKIATLLEIKTQEMVEI